MPLANLGQHQLGMFHVDADDGPLPVRTRADLATSDPEISVTSDRQTRWRLATCHRFGISDWVVVGVLIAARIALGLIRLSLPGLQNDEVLFVNAATLGVPHMFLQDQVLGVPILVFPYIGALKSWVYIPIFATFGESAMSIRLPAELITTAGLALLYPALQSLVNRPVALLALALLCFDNSLFWLTRDDVGPSALEFSLKCAGVFFAYRLAGTGRLRWLTLLVLVLALGVFNKLNFIWVVNAVALVSIGLMLARHAQLRGKLVGYMVWVAGLAVIYAEFGAYYFTQHIGLINASRHQSSVLSHTWPRWLAGTKALLSGTWFYSYALSGMAPRLVVAYALMALFMIGAVASLLPGRTRNSPLAMMALISLLITAQMLVTYDATAGWHYIASYPFIIVVACYGMWALGQLLRLPWRAAAVLLAAAAVAFLAYDGLLTVRYFQQLNREPKFSAWSPAIYRLSDYLRRQSGTVIAVDWGIQPSLFALNPNPRWHDYAFAFDSTSPAKLRLAKAGIAATRGRKLIVSYTPREEVTPHVDANLAVAERGHLRRLTTIRGDSGIPVYTVYAYH